MTWQPRDLLWASCNPHLPNVGGCLKLGESGESRDRWLWVAMAAGWLWEETRQLWDLLVWPSGTHTFIMFEGVWSWESWAEQQRFRKGGGVFAALWSLWSP